MTTNIFQAPLNISERQKLLKTQFFQVKSPQYNKDEIKLDIFKVKYKNIMKETAQPNIKRIQGTQEIRYFWQYTISVTSVAEDVVKINSTLASQSSSAKLIQKPQEMMKDALGSKTTVASTTAAAGKLNKSLQKRAEIVKTLARGGDMSLTLYKLMPMDGIKTVVKNNKMSRKEPRDKYSIEYLWNIGATCDF